MRRLLPALVVFALALPAVATATACPPSTYLYGALDPSTPIEVLPPAQDTTFSIQACDRVHGRFRVDAGLLIASIDLACAGGGAVPSGLETVVEDDFTVIGLPDGTPVALQAYLDLTGSAASFSEPGGSGGGRVRGLVREGTSNEVSLVRATTSGEPSSISVQETLVLPVSAVAGSPVRLRFAVRAEAFDGIAAMEGTFRFAALPAGAAVQSCRGYSSSAPVRTRTGTWGALKSRYR